MKQKILLFLQYLFLLAGILVPMYFLHQYILRGRTIILPGTWIDAMNIDSKDRIWLATSDGVIMIENMKITPFVIGQSEWATEIGIDENGEIWAIVGKGWKNPYSVDEIYQFDGKAWIFQRIFVEANPSFNELPCCLYINENMVSETQINEYSAFLEMEKGYRGSRRLYLQDQHGNIWAGTSQGLVHFLSDFHPSPTFRKLHIFLTSGGYWVLGIFITIVYFARFLKIGHLRNIRNYILANGKAMLGTSNPIAWNGIIGAYIGSIPGVVLGLFLGYGLGCGYVIYNWIGGCIVIPLVGMALSFIGSKLSKSASRPTGKIVSGIGGFIIGFIVGYMGIPAAC